MLVLTRRVGEKLIIADEIVVQVLAINGEQVKIGIDAPISITVFRNEVYEAILDSMERDFQLEERLREE